MLVKLPAFRFAAVANIESDRGHFGKRRCILCSERAQRSTNGRQFADASGACAHGLIASCEEFVTVLQANLACADAVTGGVN